MSNPKLIFFTLFICFICPAYAQRDTMQIHFKDSSQRTIQNTVTPKMDTISSSLLTSAVKIKTRTTASFKYLKNLRPDSIAQTLLPFLLLPKPAPAKKIVSFYGGHVSYNYNYRSNIDTPLVQKNISQHAANGSLRMGVAGIPLKVNFLLRQSNSMFFRDINDVQVEFDAQVFRGGFQNNLRQKLKDLGKQLEDSIITLDYKLKLEDFNRLNKLYNDPRRVQKAFESKEVLNIKEPADLKDTAELQTIRLLKKEATLFIQQYEQQKKELDSVNNKKEIVEATYHKMKNNLASFNDFLKKDFSAFTNPSQLSDSLKIFGLSSVQFPAGYKFFMNTRKLALGKNQVNYSELTSKNISLTGINFEYASWYYVAVTAGTVDYRFRDFVVRQNHPSPQYMYMARLGVGRPEQNHFIMSAYKGRKQLFVSSNTSGGNNSIDINGFAAEGKWRFHKNGFLLAEAAQSLSPDFRTTPFKQQKFSFTDRSNKALSVKLFFVSPKTNSKLDANYKYAGANFQSFSSFQTNSQVRAWNVKLDQQFFHKTLKVIAALRTNEYTNPYIVQNYKANTAFKSLQIVYRSRKLPMISVGYVPVSQLTYINEVLSESRFYSFNATTTHTYKFYTAKATTTFTYSRFYNHQPDTAFAYYNAKNIYFNQVLEFKKLMMNWAVSRSKSPGYDLLVLNGGVNVKLGKAGNVGLGFKVNNFGKDIFETGSYASIQLSLKNMGILSAVFDRSYLPANGNRFVRSDMMNLNFTKQLF